MAVPPVTRFKGCDINFSVRNICSLSEKD